MKLLSPVRFSYTFSAPLGWLGPFSSAFAFVWSSYTNERPGIEEEYHAGWDFSPLTASALARLLGWGPEIDSGEQRTMQTDHRCKDPHFSGKEYFYGRCTFGSIGDI